MTNPDSVNSLQLLSKINAGQIELKPGSCVFAGKPLSSIFRQSNVIVKDRRTRRRTQLGTKAEDDNTSGNFSIDGEVLRMVGSKGKLYYLLFFV